MKLYERFGERGYHTSIATTFGIDFDAYENIMLPRLRGAGCHNNIVMPDDAMLTQALGGASALPRQAGRLYTVSGMKAGGAFHPKLFLQFGREGGRMIVSSANITSSGLAGNLELAGEMACEDGESGEQRLIAQAWRYALRIAADGGQALAAQIAWMESRTPWLRRATPAQGAVALADGTQAALLITGGGTGIGAQYRALIDDAPVRRLIVVSPYWDDRLEALRHIAQNLSAPSVAVLIDGDMAAFPKEAVPQVKGLQLYDRGKFREGRFIHAKMIIAQTRTSDHVLCGSANCTVAALGGPKFAGLNEEVCLYRRLPAGSMLSALDLDDFFGKEGRIDPRDLKPPERESDLDLAEWKSRSPGRFECQYDILIWTPPPALDPDSVAIELLDANGEALPCALTPQSAKLEGQRRYQIGKAMMRPAFARLRHRNGEYSVPAIIALIDKVRESAKEPRSKAAENAANQLAQETEEGLWLLDVLDTLEAAEREQQRGDASVSIKRDRKKEDKSAAPEQHRKLSYEEFMKARRPRAADSAVVHNSLAGSELSIVRGFMNRILGLSGEEDEQPEGDDEAAPGGAFNLGDETGNAEEAVEQGELKGLPTDLIPAESDESKAQKLKAQRKATREEIIEAAEAFVERLGERKKDGTLTTFDILRLRALLMIVAAAGWAGREGRPEDDKPRTSLQVLPVENGGSAWPHALGRILFGFFGGTDPAIRHIRIDAAHDQISDDILESWATCFWAIQACLNAPVTPQARAKFAPVFMPVAEKVYRLTGLRTEEMLAENITAVMNRMSERFASRLGLGANALKTGHETLTRRFLERAPAAIKTATSPVNSS
jgi:hypothetical protein